MLTIFRTITTLLKPPNIYYNVRPKKQNIYNSGPNMCCSPFVSSLVVFILFFYCQILYSVINQKILTQYAYVNSCFILWFDFIISTITMDPSKYMFLSSLFFILKFCRRIFASRIFSKDKSHTGQIYNTW